MQKLKYMFLKVYEGEPNKIMNVKLTLPTYGSLFQRKYYRGARQLKIILKSLMFNFK